MRSSSSTLVASKLVRLLGAGLPLAVESPGMDFAERLSLWLGAVEAIGLQAAHQAVRGIAAGDGARPPGPRHAPAVQVADDVQRVRSVLARAIAQDPLAGGESAPGYAPYHQRHLQLQRQMEQMIAPLRDHVRQCVSRVSPRLQQLAALDAGFEQVLAAREQALLAKVPSLLMARFAQSREAGGAAPAFAAEWRAALLAELDLRLEPVAGLVDALGHELKNR